ADTLSGSTGNDTYITDGGDTVVESSGAGTDTVQSTATYTLGSNVENLTLTGSSAINGTGNTLANVIVGNTGANLITGGAGKDTMTGGAGIDRFDFNAVTETGLSSSSWDVITDFKSSGADRIDVSTIDANGSGAGSTAFTFLVAKDAAFTAAGQLRW